MLYDLFLYDVWGNSDDGFEVNDVYLHQRNIELSDDDLQSPDNLFHALVRLGFMKADRDIDLFWLAHTCGKAEVTFDYDGRPIGEFRRVADLRLRHFIYF